MRRPSFTSFMASRIWITMRRIKLSETPWKLLVFIKSSRESESSSKTMQRCSRNTKSIDWLNLYIGTVDHAHNRRLLAWIAVDPIELEFKIGALTMSRIFISTTPWFLKAFLFLITLIATRSLVLRHSHCTT